MKTETLTMVRIYLTESEHHAHKLLEFLRSSGVRGATLIRGVSGFGQSGRWHEVGWADLIGDLPLILEFAEAPDKVALSRQLVRLATDVPVRMVKRAP